jgi:hypothetical protein
MRAYDKIFPVVYLFMFMLVQAMYQKEYFLSDKPAGRKWHFWQAVFYGIAMTVVIPFAIYFGWWVGVKLTIIGILERLALFSPMLNLLRFKSFFYNGRGSTGSWQNKIENKLSDKWVIILKIVYIIAFICAAILIK